MIPVSLQISGFLSYNQSVTIDFTQFDLACISGANGAGKSSLLDAITWALFGEARRHDDAIINSRSKSAEVILIFDYEGHRYRIQRAKTANKATLLEFTVQDDGKWRPLTEHSVRETEERIVQTLRMDYETFTNASFFLQGRADQFAQQRPGDRKRILASILGLEVWDSYRDAAAERRKRQESELAIIDAQLEEINTELSEEDQRRKNLRQFEEQLAQAGQLRKSMEESLGSLRRLADSLAQQKNMVDLLQNQVVSARQRLQANADQLSERREEHAANQAQVAAAAEIEADFKRWQELQAELGRRDSQAANFNQYQQQRSGPVTAIQTERARLEQESAGLLTQQGQIEEIQQALPGLDEQLDASEQCAQALSERLDRRGELEEQRQQRIQQQADAQSENKRLREEMRLLRERIDRLAESSGAACPLCGQPLSPDDRLALIADLECQGKEMGDRFRQNQHLVTENDALLAEFTAEVNALRQVEADLRKQQAQHAALQTLREQNAGRIDEWQSGGARRLSELKRILEEEDYAHEARAELAGVDAALRELGYDAAAHDELRREESAARASQERLRKLEAARAALAPLERQIAGLEKQVAADEKEVTAAEAKFNEADGQYRKAAAALPDLNGAEDQVRDQKERENQLRMQVGMAHQQVEVLKSVRARQKNLRAQREDATRQIGQLRQLERAFGKDGVPALLIEQALPEIEAQANEILDRLSAGSMSVRFATQRDYKDKNRDDKKETLDILISDTAGTREYEMFSGGEAFRVNFAIRLALSRVLAQRAGARLQTLVIDEGFGSQDADGRQRLIEAINSVSHDFAKILVITHMEELKDYFPARIEIEKTDSGSSAKVVAP
ncbi:ATPase [Longilinea arvoryzae]|uniref:Nuclease SbcCD subunit C n=1 Tax=Longilinea arvoryzae TaxID=360412 RepID=A0A0S7BEJ7_9CHLR|nr:SMC family ATPase [Longilinea arvoryzae]GAP13881.1 ATPase [Longilinea arvoryzae]